MITTLSNDRVFLDYGPMQMMLAASAGDRAMTAELRQAAAYAVKVLKELAEVQSLAKERNTANRLDPAEAPLALKLMVEAVEVAGDETLTPMAAVAGAFADIVADLLAAKGASKVLINNGGDIAVRLCDEEKTRIGLTPGIDSTGFTHVVNLAGKDCIGGVATSGLGGRSFTKGIAGAVTILAHTARVADACATIVANHCFAVDPGIIQLPAEKIDPNTDIPGHLVTVHLGNLEPGTKEKALANGLAKAKELVDKDVIYGAVIFLDTGVAMVPEGLCQPK